MNWFANRFSKRAKSLYWWKPAPNHPMGISSNIGDELNRNLYVWLTGKEPRRATEQTRGKVLAIGSVLHNAQPGDVVWGSGLNGRVTDREGKIRLPKRLESIHFKAVRGPLTRQLLVDAGADVPEIYGDPALLVRQFITPPVERRGTLVFPHYTDMPLLLEQWAHPSETLVWNAEASVESTIAAINASERVISSAMHGIILADALGVPVVPMRLGTRIPLFKYHDYWLGTQREPVDFTHGLNEALSAEAAPPPTFDEALFQGLIDSCPFDLKDSISLR